jgi:hypothetical protein
MVRTPDSQANFAIINEIFTGGLSRATREGWPLLIVETEVDGIADSRRTYERGPFLIGSLGLSCRYRIFLFWLGCSSRPSTKYFSLAVHYVNAFVPTAQ